MARRFKRTVKKSPESDPQQYQVYRMENEAIGARRYLALTRANCEMAVRSLCKTYGMPQIDVWFQDLGRWAAEWRQGLDGKPNKIILGKKTTSRDLLTVAHEVAHNLHYHLVPTFDQQGHGPEFMACYMSVLDTMRFIPVAGMAAICDNYKIKYILPPKNGSIQGLQRLIKGK